MSVVAPSIAARDAEREPAGLLTRLHDWVVTVDHKRLGIMYVVAGFGFLVIAGAEATMMRVQLAWPGLHVVSPETFNRLTRDIYVPPGDQGFWQGVLRDPHAPEFAVVRKAVENGELIMIDLLYEDHEGGQRTISRFGLMTTESGSRITATSRHWNLDRDDPRSG